MNSNKLKGITERYAQGKKILNSENAIGNISGYTNVMWRRITSITNTCFLRSKNRLLQRSDIKV
ncbi:MAG: hypothetical protein M3015_11690 [Bacteroidota bacterium]|nr:hypothetical protein [Bacteroidota bacterium]